MPVDHIINLRFSIEPSILGEELMMWVLHFIAASQNLSCCLWATLSHRVLHLRSYETTHVEIFLKTLKKLGLGNLETVFVSGTRRNWKPLWLTVE